MELGGGAVIFNDSNAKYVYRDFMTASIPLRSLYEK